MSVQPLTLTATVPTDRGVPILEGLTVRCAQLRPPRDAADDVDLLVSPDDLPTLVQHLVQLGLVEEPSFGRGSHRFFLGLREQRFVRVDVVTGLEFGPLQLWSSRMEDAVLTRADRTAAHVLAPEDELWVTVLHLLADDGASPVDPTRLSSVGELARSVNGEVDPEWDRALASILPRGVTPADVVAVLREDPEISRTVLLLLRRELRRRTALRGFAQRGPAAVGRVLWLRGTEQARQWRGRRGLLVAVLGPDGAGKSTLLDALEQTWPWPHRRIYFGLWPDVRRPSALSSALWPLRRPPRATSRYARGLAAALRGRLVLFDRYVYDAAVPPEGRARALKRAYFSVLLRCAPHPDMAVLLQAPGDVLFARKGEMSPERLDANAAALLAHLRRAERRGRPRVLTVDATRPPAEVAGVVVAAVWSLAAARLTGRDKGDLA